MERLDHFIIKTVTYLGLTTIVSLFFLSCTSQNPEETFPAIAYDNIPEGYLDEAEEIPDFWLTTIEEINEYVKKRVKKGKVEICGTSAGGRSILSISYGKKRTGAGTTTFSGALALPGIESYRGTDHGKLVYMGLAGVHGFELEGIIGIINMLEVLETGRDLNGKEWTELSALADSLDRIVLLPLVSPDGRARLPIRMEPNRGGEPNSFTVHEYLNTGGKKDGTIIGWPDVKEFIPMDFAQFGFPGGYPNDAGINIMHDDFFGSPQPETQLLLDLTADERPDLIINMHTGVPKNNYFMQLHRPFTEPELQPIFDILYRKIKTSLTHHKLQGSADASFEADPSRKKMTGYNLNTALNLHCGALSVTIESPSHGYFGTNLAGEPALQTPEMLLDAQLIAHQASLKFLLETKGRSGWEKDFYR